MTRKDYKLIAEVIKSAILERPTDNQYLAVKMALRLGKENKRFDKNKFIDACGFPIKILS
jgi:hypothetical protein